MRLSYTALKTFQQCRFRYRLRYDRGLATQPRPAAQYSRALHGALHLFHQGLKDRQTGENALSRRRRPPLIRSLPISKATTTNPTRPLTESQYQEGRAILARYWEAHRGQFPTPYLLEEAKKPSLYLNSGQKEGVKTDNLTAAQAQVRALCRDIGREKEFHPHEGAWCASCDFQEFCPVKAINPRPVPVSGRARQLGFDFAL